MDGLLARLGREREARGPMAWLLAATAGLAACGPGGEPPRPAPRRGPAHEADPAALAVDVASFERDLAAIARPRPPGSAQWQLVQDLCARRFEALGYTVERVAYGSGVNVIGTRKGSERPGDIVLVSAHYDSTENCAGADDNATGVAATLEMARMLGRRPSRRTLTVACWDEEERGLVGSSAYAAALDNPDALDLVLVFEMIGYVDDDPGSQTMPPGLAASFPAAARQLEANLARGDFLAVIHDQRARAAAESLEELGARRDLPVIRLEVPDALKSSPAARDLQRSDHAPFWRRDVAAMMLTDTANFRNPRYHCGGGADSVDSLDPAFAAKVIQAAAATVAGVLDR